MCAKRSQEDGNMRVQALDDLFTSVGRYRDSASYRELLEFVRRFPSLAPYNAMLIHMQRPGTTYVLSASQWRAKYSRNIKPGARPLVILVPFGPVAFVFDIEDTEGGFPVPDCVLQPFRTKGCISESRFARLIGNLPCVGITYVEADFGSQQAGYIRMLERPVYRDVPEKRVVIRARYELTVNKNHALEDRFATIVHELGHFFCGHFEPAANGRSALDTKTEEFEAESVAWLVCERLGLHAPSCEYLAQWLGEERRIPHISLDSVLKAVLRIEQMLARSQRLDPDIIVEDYREKQESKERKAKKEDKERAPAKDPRLGSLL